MDQNYIRLLRHATLIIQIGNLKLLVDPMLSEKDAMDPVQNCENNFRIPMVELPLDKKELDAILKEVDAVVVTHTHRDHWDAAAQNLVDKNKLLFCQPADAEKIRLQGFLNVKPIEEHLVWKGVSIHRTKGQHGTGEIGQKMGEVSGFVFDDGKQSIYIAGDTIWCADVEAALTAFRPGTIVVNAGAAQFLSGSPITMTAADVIKVQEASPAATIIAVHMDTVNHCLLKRADLKKALAEINLVNQVKIPLDGETIRL